MNTEPCPRCRELGNDTRGDNLVVWSDGGKHCFACGLHVNPPWKFPVAREEINAKQKTALPSDFQREVPARAWQWVLQYGLPFSYWQDYCGYSPKEERLIFCVPDIRTVSFSIGRYIGPPGLGSDLEREILHDSMGQAGGSLQVVSSGVEAEGRSFRKWHAYGDCHQSAHVLGDYRSVQEVVLVEDLISAHKVGRVACAIPLFGTRVFDGCVATLRHIGLPIALWLDSDQKNGIQKKASNLSMLTNLPVRYIFTEKDPKAITYDEIKSILSK